MAFLNLLYFSALLLCIKNTLLSYCQELFKKKFTLSTQWKVLASLNFTVGGVAKRDNFHNPILSIDKN
jgi:hypothetical protein